MKDPSAELLSQLYHFYESLFPIPAIFELPDNQHNPTLYIDEYRRRYLPKQSTGFIHWIIQALSLLFGGWINIFDWLAVIMNWLYGALLSLYHAAIVFLIDVLLSLLPSNHRKELEILIYKMKVDTMDASIPSKASSMTSIKEPKALWSSFLSVGLFGLYYTVYGLGIIIVIVMIGRYVNKFMKYLSISYYKKQRQSKRMNPYTQSTTNISDEGLSISEETREGKYQSRKRMLDQHQYEYDDDVNENDVNYDENDEVEEGLAYKYQHVRDSLDSFDSNSLSSPRNPTG